MKIPKLFLLISSVLFLSCNLFYKDNGRMGESRTKEEASKNGSDISLYVPDKKSFQLLDGSALTTDTAWTEVSFSYNNGERVLDSSFGFIFSIPYKQADPDKFTFTFSLLDKTNEMFTNGIEKKICHLRPKELQDEIKVKLEQMDPDTSKGWTNPLVTDTITYRRLRR